MARRLRDELLRRLLPPMAAILLASGVFSYHLAFSFADRSYDRSLLEDARSISRLVGGRDGGPLTLPAAAVEMLEPGDGDHAFFQIRNARDEVIAGAAELPSPPRRRDAGEYEFFDSELRGEKMRLVAIALPHPKAEEAALVLVGETRHRRDSLASDIVVAVLVPQLVLILFAVAVIVGGVSSGLRPLEALARSIEARRRDELTFFSDVQVPGEAAPLIDAFNGLLRRLAEVLASQQRFVADAAHQLRTPLAALKIQLEQTLREADGERRRQLLEQLKASVDRTARLSDQLLLLARAEPGGEAVARSSVDLCALARDIGGQWVPCALQLGRDLGFCGGDGPVMVVGDETLLGEMIANLLDNALRYGGPSVTLRVVPGSADAGPELAVEDDGPGIPPVEQARVFDRFHRVPGTVGEGSGLGLAIVREIAHGHGAAVAVETPAAGGLRVRVRFPLSY